MMRAPAMTHQNSPWRNPWVVGWIGLILIVLLVNLIMVYLAVTTSPGLVVSDYYDRGQRLERAGLQRPGRDQQLLLQVNRPEQIFVNRETRFGVVGVDKTGLPIQPESATLFAYRPSDASADFSAPMSADGPGRYSTTVAFPLKGIWDLIISVKQNGEEHSIVNRIGVLDATR